MKLEKDYYFVKSIGKNITFQKILLAKNEPHWEWQGILHETLVSSKTVQGEMLEGIVNQYNVNPGSRSSDPKKWSKDIIVLEEELKRDPSQGRYLFYLAQTYAVSGQLDKALECYQRRVSLGQKIERDKEELFWSLYSIGCLQSDLHWPDDTVIDSFLNAFSFDSTRAEPLYRLATHFQRMESYILGYVVIQWAKEMPMPHGAQRMQHAVYQYLIALKFAELAASVGKREESLSAYTALLDNPHAPEEAKEIARKNIALLQDL